MDNNSDLQTLTDEGLQHYIDRLQQQADQQAKQFDSKIREAQQEQDRRIKNQVLEAQSILKPYSLPVKEAVSEWLKGEIDPVIDLASLLEQTPINPKPPRHSSGQD